VSKRLQLTLLKCLFWTCW